MKIAETMNKPSELGKNQSDVNKIYLEQTFGRPSYMSRNQTSPAAKAHVK